MGTLTEEIDLRIRTLVKPECLIPPPPPPELNSPNYQMDLPSSYNAPIKTPNGMGWILYDVLRKIHLFNINWTYLTESQTNAPAGSVIMIKENQGEVKYLARQHYKSAFNADYESLYSKSQNGNTFTPVYRDRNIQGEDANMIQSSSGTIWNFMRPSRVRDLVVQKFSTAFVVSSVTKLLIRHNTPLSKHRDVYCACPVIIQDGTYPEFLLFVSLYRKGDQGQDVEQPPPYGIDEQTVDGYLYYYNSLTDTIRILNNGKPIIPRTGNQQQSYNWASLGDDGYLWINNGTCEGKHVLGQDQTLVNRLYKWKLSDAMNLP